MHPSAQEPVLCVEPFARVERAERRRLSEELLELGSRHPHTRGIRTFLFHRGFPVDIRHNAKIGRPELARWAARKLGARRRSPASALT